MDVCGSPPHERLQFSSDQAGLGMKQSGGLAATIALLLAAIL
jgi:hypothetical protein